MAKTTNASRIIADYHHLYATALQPHPFATLLVWLLLAGLSGLLIGALARLLVPGHQDMGLLATAGYGMIGSFLGGLIGWLVLGGAAFGLVFAVLGAAALISALEGSHGDHDHTAAGAA